MTHHDVVVVGGGPAGLQAALTLGRVHRSVLLLDAGSYRNDAATHLHNVVTRDGTPPAEFRAVARRELAAYPDVEVRDAAASRIEPDGTGWAVRLVGGDVATGRLLVLATGVRDTLPPTPGLQDGWGDLVAHCPFCHGHELAGRHLGVLGSGPHVVRVAGLVTPLAASVTVFADGARLDSEAELAALGARVVAAPVTEVRRTGDRLDLHLAGGAVEELGGLFVATTLRQSAPFAEQLGLELLPSGCIRVDELGRTSRPGVYAAGDAAHLAALPMPMASVLTAAAAGLLAASAATQELMTLTPQGAR